MIANVVKPCQPVTKVALLPILLHCRCGAEIPKPSLFLECFKSDSFILLI